MDNGSQSPPGGREGAAKTGLSACQGQLGNLDTNGGGCPGAFRDAAKNLQFQVLRVTVSLLETGPSERNRLYFSQFGQLVI